LVAFLVGTEVLQRKTAFEARPYFLHVILEALQRLDLAIPEDDMVAQQARARTALDEAFEYITTGDGTDPGSAEDLSDLDQAGDVFALLGGESIPDSAAFTSSTAS
jgi:hypothetical protein